MTRGSSKESPASSLSFHGNRGGFVVAAQAFLARLSTVSQVDQIGQ
jgi:hypothetical protein